MCWYPRSSSSSSKPTKSMTSLKRRVTVYDTETRDLRKLPLKIIQEEGFREVKVPRFGRFDLYASNDEDSDSDDKDDELTPPQNEVRVIHRASQNTEGMSFRARLNYGGLGPITNVKRVFSARSRVLYIGAVPT